MNSAAGMWVYLNDGFVEESRALVGIGDRGFRYGDGLFETVPMMGGRLFRWADHYGRLRAGAAVLGIELRENADALEGVAVELAGRCGIGDGLVRIQLTRGTGPRGYSPRGARDPVLVATIHPQPVLSDEPWTVMVSRHRVTAGDPLARLKTCSKLLHVMARAEADEAGADEALLVDSDGYVCGATSASLLWLREGALEHVPADAAALSGVTRGVVVEWARAQGWEVRERRVTVPELQHTEGVCLALSSRGVVAVREVHGRRMKVPEAIEALRAAYWKIRQTPELGR